MPKAYTSDFRERVIEAVEAGASRHEAADCFEVSASSAIRWVQAWRDEGRRAAKPRGGSRSALEDRAGEILSLTRERSDSTLDELVVALRKQGIGTSRTSLWRFFHRQRLSFKKKSTRSRARASRRGARPPSLDQHARSA